MTLSGAFARLKMEFTDYVRFSAWGAVTKLGVQRARTAVTRDPARRLEREIETYRLAQTGAVANRSLNRIRAALAAGVSPSLSEANARSKRWIDRASALNRTLILKAPAADGEKGVLLVFGEYNWLRMLHSLESVKRVQTLYDWVLIAGWSPADYTSLIVLAQLGVGPFFVEPGNYSEHPVIARLHPQLIPTPTICSDWGDPSRFAGRPKSERDIDLLMVANWSPYKRHWHLFQALHGMRADLKVTLIGQPDGPFVLDRIKRQADEYGARQEIEFLNNPPAETVFDRMGRAKVSVIVSKREGPCVVVTESMLCDTPVGLLVGAHVGTASHINSQTGRLLDGKRLASELTDLIAQHSNFCPREWAVSHITCHQSITKLNQCVRVSARQRNLPWTQDLTTYHWRPYPGYLDSADAHRFAPYQDQLTREHPQLFGPNTFQ